MPRGKKGSGSRLSTAVSDQQVKAPATKPQVLALLDKQLPAIKRALPRHINPDHFVRSLTTLIRRTPKLLECDPITVIAGSMLAAQLGMEVGPLGQCYLIPRKNRHTGRMEANFQLGYKGALKLAQNSNQIAGITCEEVRSNDDWSITLGDEAEYHHVPAPWGTDRGPVIGYYAVISTKTGGKYRAAMSLKEVTDHAKRYSEAAKRGTGPWGDQEQKHSMGRKTVLLRALKLAPMDIELAEAIGTDGLTSHNVDATISEALAEAEVIDVTPEDAEEPKPPAEEPQDAQDETSPPADASPAGEESDGQASFLGQEPAKEAPY